MSEPLIKIIVKAAKFIIFSLLAFIAGIYAAISHLGNSSRGNKKAKRLNLL